MVLVIEAAVGEVTSTSCSLHGTDDTLSGIVEVRGRGCVGMCEYVF